MKKKILWVCILLIIIVLFYANLTKQENIKENKVVATFYPVYISLLNLTDGVDIQVENITKDVTTCLHDYSLTTNQMAKIEDANLVVINGMDMEPFVKNLSKDIKILDSSKNTKAIYTEHNEQNSHIYLDIDNYIIQTENICNGLVEIDVNNEDKYTENKIKFVDRLNVLKNEYITEKENLKDTKVIIYNGAIEYIANMLGLDVIANLEFDHDNGISSDELIDVIEKIKKEKIKYILVSSDYDKESISTITKELDIDIIELDLFVYGVESKDAYINVMKNNLNELKTMNK